MRTLADQRARHGLGEPGTPVCTFDAAPTGAACPRRTALARGLAGAALACGGPLLLAGCATRRPDTDGLPDRLPAGLERVPDAVPRIEPIRAGGPNKPYEVGGRLYVPFTADRPLREVGGASWYGRRYHGRPTSLGEPYDMFAMTAAHPVMPLPSYARVRNPANGRQVIVRVNDRGPFVAGRVIDLSYTAALRLDVHRSVARVLVERITFEQIRRGTWRQAQADTGPEEADQRPPVTSSTVPVT